MFLLFVMMQPPFQFFLPCCFLHLRSPAFPPGAILPSFNGFCSIGITEYQGVTVLHSDSRYSTAKGIQTTNHFLGGGNQNIFRDLLGLAECFPTGIEGWTNPDRSGCGIFPPVILTTSGADQQPGKRILSFIAVGCVILFCPPLNLFLNCVKLLQRNDCFMGILYVVHRKLTVIPLSALAKVVF